MQDSDDIYPSDHDDSKNDGDGVNKDNDTQQPLTAGNMNVHSQDIPDESHDIDEEMEKIGKDINPEDPKPLGE